MEARSPRLANLQSFTDLIEWILTSSHLHVPIVHQPHRRSETSRNSLRTIRLSVSEPRRSEKRPVPFDLTSQQVERGVTMVAGLDARPMEDA